MSLLPQYHSVPTEDEEAAPPPWSKTDNDPFNERYPLPPPATSSGTGPIHNVAFTFEPRFPIVAERQDVVGIMGIDKADTVAIVQRAFPILQQYYAERLEFSIGVETTLGGSHWSKVMDEAWPGMIANPPSRILVQVADGPGDLEARLEQEYQRGKYKLFAEKYLPKIFGGVFAAGFLIMFVGVIREMIRNR